MSRLRIAVPNKGRLQQPALQLLRDAGLVFEKTDRALSVPVRNVAIDLLFVRTEDVPEMVQDGAAALGITGIDLLDEMAAHDVSVVAELGFGRCRLVAAVPEGSAVEGLEDLAGLRIATAHPGAVERFFADKSIPVTVVPLRGSVEVAPTLGVGDAIVDLVSSGSTMLINGLRPVVTLLESQAVLVAGPRAVGEQAAEVSAVATMLRAVVAGRSRRYVLMNAPAEAVPAIEALIPGLEAPTVVPLAHDGMVAVHSVVAADDVWTLLPRLEGVGASGILVLGINQLIA
jgi:ATP phosphoribosyltransferase